MKYYNNLKEYENWENHYNFIVWKFPKNEEIIKTLELVKKYHNDERFLYKWIYNRHPLRVARILIENFYIEDKNTIIVALLHDILERSEYPEKELLNNFWKDIYNLVKILSLNDNQKWNDFVLNIEKTWNKNLIAIKIADKLDNNRWVFFSNNDKEILKAITKTNNTIKPLTSKIFPKILEFLEESIENLENIKKIW